MAARNEIVIPGQGARLSVRAFLLIATSEIAAS